MPAGRMTRVWAWLALLGVLLLKTRLEERALAARFPDYRRYAAATPRLVPNPIRCWGGSRRQPVPAETEPAGRPDEARMMLDRRVAHAEQALARIAGGRSMCEIGRSGQSFPAAKFHEGVVSALAEVRRRVEQDEAADVGSAARAAAEDWRTRAEGISVTGPDWSAYLAGGTQALNELVAELGGSD